jgi:myo-inositol-1(or 4)-monophosphatase
VSEVAPAGLLEIAVQAARLAGELLAERFSRGAEAHVSSKSSPTDLVSEADLLAERSIRELLSSRRPDDGFLGEEGEGDSAGGSGLRWVVDPLDGTVNYLFGIPQWCVSVAVQEQRSGATLAGAVYDPGRGELFTATRDGPARLIARGDGGEGVELHGRAGRPGEEAREDIGSADLAGAMVATGLAYDAGVRAAQARVLARTAPLVRDIRRFGSAALDLCWTACGRWDAYFERTVKPWDIAAGVLVCERAGLRALELAPATDLPWGILVARPGLAEALLAVVDGS